MTIKAPMRAFLALTSLLVAGCGLTSGLSIEPDTQFDLGANEHGAFVADVENRGDVPVEIIARSSDGDATSIAVIAPGASVRHRFGAEEMATFVNASDQTARLQVHVRGDTGLSMDYSPAGADTGSD